MPTDISNQINTAIQSIEQGFTGGLSNTSTRKFDSLVPVISELTGLAENDIYVTAAMSRASNIWNRLTQGKPTQQHFKLGICIVSPAGISGALAAGPKFIGTGIIRYDSIAIIANVGGKWTITDILTNNSDDIAAKIKEEFPNASVKTCVNTENDGTVGVSEEEIAENKSLKRLFSDWLVSRGVEESTPPRFPDSVEAVSMPYPGKKNTNVFEGIFERLTGCPPEVGVFEISSVDEFNRVYKEFNRFIDQESEDSAGFQNEEAYKECYSYTRDRAPGGAYGYDAGRLRSAWKRYREFIQSIESLLIKRAVKMKSRQLIYYGAPGTGKSFQTDKIAKLYDDTIRVTFHPDSDYASFVGCYKPSMTPVQRVNCIDDKAKLVKNADGTPSMTEAIVYKFVPQAFAKAYVKAWEKMAAADSPERVPLQFLVIEEINRGNCAQIFGDLFQLLDRDDNGYSKYPVDPDTDFGKHLAEVFEKLPADPATRLSIDTTLANAKKKWEDVREGRVLVLPPNLYIWATMNTSDQSLFPIDSAFKRRWGWEYVPIADADKKWAVVANKKRFDWWAFLEKANDAVREATKSEDKELGYFFVKPPAGSTDIPAKTFVDKVLFYLFGDAFKDDVPPMSLFPKKKGDSKPWTLRDFRKNVLEGGSAKSLPNEEALAEWLEQIGIKAPDADETADTATAASAATDEAAAGPATDEPAES